MISKNIRSYIYASLLYGAIGCVNLVFGAEQPQTDNARGKLLYSLHCVACHSEQVHWMANKKVSDWPSLLAQVKLWQNISNLKWNDKDIDNVAKYLNSVYYHYPLPNTVARKK